MKNHKQNLNKMKKDSLCVLTPMLVIAFVISIANPGFAEQKKLQVKKGNIVCLEVDKKGNINTIEDYTECNGLFIFYW